MTYCNICGFEESKHPDDVKYSYNRHFHFDDVGMAYCSKCDKDDKCMFCKTWHECEKPNHNIIQMINKNWTMSVINYFTGEQITLLADLKFCPYCGIKLEHGKMPSASRKPPQKIDPVKDYKIR